VSQSVQEAEVSNVRLFKPYPAYKSSGMEWLGDVPEHWDVKRLKFVGDAIIGLTYDPSDLADEADGVLVLRASNVARGRIVREDNVFVKTKIPPRLITRLGDILVCSRSGSRALIGKNAKIDADSAGVTFGTFMTVFRSNCNDYLFYVFNSTLFEYQSGVFLTSTINQLTVANLYSFEVPTPPPDEQATIVRFLDRETARIDTLIAKKQALIRALKEKRSALLSRTVTRGLPPDAACGAGFEPHPPLKPSGAEWLGKVPAHWEVKQLKWAIMFQRGHDLPTDERQEGNVPLVSSSGKSDTHSIAVAKGPGIVTGRYGTIGEFHLVEEDYWPLNTTLYSIHLYGNEPRFLRYMLINLSPLFLLNAIKSAVPGIDRNDIHPVTTAIPPLKEQCAIADYLDRESAKLDSMVVTIDEAIERMQEYRTALITSAVTGKIDVRGETA
jgi:type I restriction enzyme, S subunit